LEPVSPLPHLKALMVQPGYDLGRLLPGTLGTNQPLLKAGTVAHICGHPTIPALSVVSSMYHLQMPPPASFLLPGCHVLSTPLKEQNNQSCHWWSTTSVPAIHITSQTPCTMGGHLSTILQMAKRAEEGEWLAEDNSIRGREGQDSRSSWWGRPQFLEMVIFFPISAPPQQPALRTAPWLRSQASQPLPSPSPAPSFLPNLHVNTLCSFFLFY
jgi:hypothetical protein